MNAIKERIFGAVIGIYIIRNFTGKREAYFLMRKVWWCHGVQLPINKLRALSFREIPIVCRCVNAILWHLHFVRC
mgnify:CR=1 FL=1